MKHILAAAALLISATSANADAPKVENASARQTGATWTVSVTLSHPDTGWDHYADGWEVLAPDGTSLGLRVLVHPHVEEQPFTRSLSGVTIPEGTETLLIRARCNVDGWNADTFEMALPGS